MLTYMVNRAININKCEYAIVINCISYTRIIRRMVDVINLDEIIKPANINTRIT